MKLFYFIGALVSMLIVLFLDVEPHIYVACYIVWATALICGYLHGIENKRS